MIKFCLFLLMDVNRILENYVIRQVFVLVGVIFLVFGGIFLAAPVRRFTLYL